MASIFISYRRTDNAVGYSRSLATALRREFGESQVFRDIKSIPPGEDFPTFIVKTLEQCRVMLVLIGTHWAGTANLDGQRRLDDGRDWVRREVAAALAADTLVIPILLCGARMPTADELPGDLAQLASRNAFVMSDDDWEHDLSQLVSTLRTHLNLPGVPDPAGDPPSAAPPQAPAPVGRRTPSWSPGRDAPGLLQRLLSGLFGWIRSAALLALIVWIGYTQHDGFAAGVDRFLARSAQMLARLMP